MTSQNRMFVIRYFSLHSFHIPDFCIPAIVPSHMSPPIRGRLPPRSHRHLICIGVLRGGWLVSDRRFDGSRRGRPDYRQQDPLPPSATPSTGSSSSCSDDPDSSSSVTGCRSFPWSSNIYRVGLLTGALRLTDCAYSLTALFFLSVRDVDCRQCSRIFVWSQFVT